MPEATTPLMRQYLTAKSRVPDALLLFRLGDFYELFYDDAVTAARELEITLTSRQRDHDSPIPMCGVPHHAAEGYVARLIQKGYKVALCDQMEDPKLVKHLVRREITRVLTPGTAAPTGDDPRYLAAVARVAEKAGAALGLAILDLATGEFCAAEFRGERARDRLREELERWRPKEVLATAEAADLAALAPPGATATHIEGWTAEPDFARRELEKRFGVLSLDGFGLGPRPAATAAAGAALHYCAETQHGGGDHITSLRYFEESDALALDAPTLRNLEILEPLTGGDPAPAGPLTLRAALDETRTPLGRRMLAAWLARPSLDAAVITARWESVEELLAGARRAALRAALEGVLDLERLLGRASLATATPRDLNALRASLDRVPAARAALAGAAAPRLAALREQLDELPALRARLAAALADPAPATMAEGGYIRAGCSAELDELRTLSRDAKGVIAAIEARERARSGIASLKVRFNGVFGYFIEVTRPNLPLVPPEYERKQTLANAERFTTPELKELEVRILSAEERARALELELFAALRAAVLAAAAAVRRDAAALAEADVLANFAEIAALRDYARPVWSDDGALEIVAGRHPVIERLSETMAASSAEAAADATSGAAGGGDRFVPNDAYLRRGGERVLLLTGPNMGGKSTYLRQIALTVIMAQAGCFAPARSARLPLCDRVFTRIGAGDNLARGRSTFMVEMLETAAILRGATPRSLVLLDEMGRGTATYDGLALAWAVVEFLHAAPGTLTLFATHYHELTELADHLSGVRNFHVAARDAPEGIVFLRQVRPGAADRSYGIEVAKLAGVPAEVIARARAVLRLHERAGRRAGDQLEAAAPSGWRAETAPPPQLTLFTPLNQAIVDRIMALDLTRTTPLEAINLLAELQRQIAGG